MKILVINCGSSSLKYQVINMEGEVLMAKGLVERIGMDGSCITHEKIGEDKVKKEVPMETHKEAIAQVLDAIRSAAKDALILFSTHHPEDLSDLPTTKVELPFHN